jgi:hypothetical protein
MSIIAANNKSSAADVLHGIACLLGTACVLLFGAFAISDPPPLSQLFNPQMWALLVMVAGLLFTWRNSLAGGALSIAGVAAFYLMNFDKAGNFPSGWVFPVCFVPGVLALLAGLLQHRRGTVG